MKKQIPRVKTSKELNKLLNQVMDLTDPGYDFARSDKLVSLAEVVYFCDGAFQDYECATHGIEMAAKSIKTGKPIYFVEGHNENWSEINNFFFVEELETIKKKLNKLIEESKLEYQEEERDKDEEEIKALELKLAALKKHKAKRK